MDNSTASPALQSMPNSWQVVLRLPNEPQYMTAAVNFTSHQEAFSWGQVASSVMAYFVNVDAWRVVGSQKPPTHTVRDGRIVRLASVLKQ